MDLNSIWFVLVGVLFMGYVILDGFDLGVGTLHLFVKDDRERRIFLNAIGPVWDGNEVWLVTAGGALFAAFPKVYATVFSGFYDAFMLLLFALIFRAVAIEFRSERPSPGWRKAWDTAFSIGSLVATLLIGVALGNLIWGVPLDSHHEFTGNVLTLLHPYSLLVGLTAVALTVMHANVYLVMKTDGELQAKLRRWTRRTVGLYLVFYVAVNAATMLSCAHIQDVARQRPWLLGTLFVVATLLTLNIVREVRRDREGRAFVSSALSIVALLALVGASFYPSMVYSNPDIANSLTIYNGASTDKTLGFMLVVAIIGMPIVVVYTSIVYYVFRGKVELTENSY